MSQSSELARFITVFLLLLLPCFLAWASMNHWLAGPAVWLCDAVLTAWMPAVVDTVLLNGSQAVVMTNFAEVDGVYVPLANAAEQIGFSADTRLLSYSFPFYAALHFATRQSERWTNLGIGFWVLFPLMVVSLICVSLKNLMLGLGPLLYEQGTVFVPGNHVIGISYQFSILIIPCVAPILIWVWQSRESTLFEGVYKLGDAAKKISHDSLK